YVTDLIPALPPGTEASSNVLVSATRGAEPLIGFTVTVILIIAIVTTFSTVSARGSNWPFPLLSTYATRMKFPGRPGAKVVVSPLCALTGMLLLLGSTTSVGSRHKSVHRIKSLFEFCVVLAVTVTVGEPITSTTRQLFELYWFGWHAALPVAHC